MTETGRPNVTESTPRQQRTLRRHLAHRNRCSICRHPEKWRLELLMAGGASVEALARKFGVGPDALGRHWKNHVSVEDKVGKLAGVANLDVLAERASESGSSVLDYLTIARNTILTQLGAAENANDGRTVGYLAGQLTRVLEVMAKVSGELVTAAGSVSVTNIKNVAILAEHPAFTKLQAATLRALRRHPGALADFVAEMRGLDEDAPASVSKAANGVLELEAIRAS
jgi:hypothetical protein